NDNYCVICGTHLFNMCSESFCSRVNQGFARYCGSCGNPTTFFISGFLYDKEGKLHPSNVYNNIDFEPIDDDEKIPF
ncbi:hypothetical protein, partial [Anaerosolibacter sp.]|uniref:hypothetical protein n=1 Tax=Anaerosolibacter sp. TaxID=1872527 RepID=UPI0039EE7CC5